MVASIAAGLTAHATSLPGGTAGPDLIVGALNGASSYGTVQGVSAYAFGLSWCNVGDDMALWCSSGVPGLCGAAEHPVAVQNLYRLRNGRLEQIGLSWANHAVCALDESICDTCTPDPHGCNALGAGCANTSSATSSGAQFLLGPRSQVNAATGDLVYPFAAPPAQPVIGRRLQVRLDDLDPTVNDGALYFAEIHTIAHDDAMAEHSLNNASHRRTIVGPLVGGAYVLSLSGSTVQELPAIHAWKQNGVGPGVPDPDVELVDVDVPGDGRFIVGCKASDNGDGTWHYEYAVFNLNSDRAARSFQVPVDPCVAVTAIRQHLPSHHSGEPWSTTSWMQERGAEGVAWSTDLFEDAPDANALRFSTLFNFRFDADQPPVRGEVTLGLFKPGPAADPVVSLLVPAGPEVTTDCDTDGVDDACQIAAGLAADCDCSGALDVCELATGLLPDCNGNAVPDACDIATGASADVDGDGIPDECQTGPDLNGDGTVDGADLGALLGSWGACPQACPADLDGDGAVDGADLGALLGSWGRGTKPPPCGTPGAGACCTPHATGGCDDPACCVAVCAVDALCCDSEWDFFCAQFASGMPECACTPPPACQLVGDCATAHPVAGCADASCAAAVCAVLPMCCTFEWDVDCAALAPALCAIGACGEGGECGDVHEAPGCDDAACCGAVCEADGYCCAAQWDATCVAAALVLCAAADCNAKPDLEILTAAGLMGIFVAGSCDLAMQPKPAIDNVKKTIGLGAFAANGVGVTESTSKVRVKLTGQSDACCRRARVGFVQNVVGETTVYEFDGGGRIEYTWPTAAEDPCRLPLCDAPAEPAFWYDTPTAGKKQGEEFAVRMSDYPSRRAGLGHGGQALKKYTNTVTFRTWLVLVHPDYPDAPTYVYHWSWQVKFGGSLKVQGGATVLDGNPMACATVLAHGAGQGLDEPVVGGKTPNDCARTGGRVVEITGF